VDGQFEVRVKVHYVNFHTNTPPTSDIQQAKNHIQNILNLHDLYIDYQSDEIHNVISGFNTIDSLRIQFFNNPPVALADNVIHIAIFDKDLVNFSHANQNGTILDASHTPTRTAAVGYPQQGNPDVLNASFAGAMGLALGIYLASPNTLENNNYHSEGSGNCHVSGDFICDTPPLGGNSLDLIDPTTCEMSDPQYSPWYNIMSFHNRRPQCLNQITEEQARKIRYTFSNELDMHKCLNSNSTLQMNDFMVTSMYTEISQNTAWDKPAALLHLKVEEGNTFTTTSRIDFAPGYLEEEPVEGYIHPYISRTAVQDASGQPKDIIFDDGKYYSGIRIEKGAKFVADGALLSSYYSHFGWRGIILVGDRNLPQTPANQALLELKNNSVINMAHEAIYPNDRSTPDGLNYYGNRIPSTTGGYIIASDTEFRNCRRVIGFREYRNIQSAGNEADNISVFEKCFVIHNNDYTFSSRPLGITLNRVNGVKILGCSFENTIQDDSGPNKHLWKGDAIYSESASYFVDQYCADPSCEENIPTTITGYHRGISANRLDNVSRSVSIQNTKFERNFYSAFFSHIDNLDFLKNELHIPHGFDYHNQYASPFPYGLYLQSSTGFHVEANYFTRFDDVTIPIERQPIGIVVSNTLTSSDKIYRNHIDGLDLGIEALGENRTSINPHNGLQFRCNTFDDGDYDIYVPEILHGQVNNVGVHQGYLNKGNNPTENKDLAGNLFSHSSTSPGFWDFENNDNSHFIAYYHHDVSNFRVYPRDDHRLNVITSEATGEDYSPSVSCPSELTESETTGNLRASMRGDLQLMEDDLTLLAQLIDGGNTPELIAQIFTTPESEFYNLYIDLINQSPYLSDQALIEVIHLPDFPDILLRNILIENPQSVHHQNVWDEVLSRNPSLPQYMIDDILNGTDYVSALQLLKGRIAHHRMNAEQKAGRLIRLYGKDYAEGELANNPMDSLLSLYDEIDMPHMYIQKAQLLNYLGLSGASNALQAAIDHPMLENEPMKVEFEAYKDVYEVLFTLSDTITTAQKSLLGGIVDDSLFGASKLAHLILWEYGVADSMLVDPTYFPSSSINKRSQRGPVEKGAKARLNRVKLYPNPASEFTTLYYQLSGIEAEIEYDLLDMAGRVILQGKFTARRVEGAELIHLPQVASGTYLLRITKNGNEVIGTEKLKINRK
jgi:hypothetical protein